MELYESLLTDEWLLGNGLAPAFYESDTVTDDGLIKPLSTSSSSDVDLLAKPFENEGLGADLDWLDNRIDFSLLDSLELLKEEPKEEPAPIIKGDTEQLSEFQNAAIDLLESLMEENNSDSVSYTTLTPKPETIDGSELLELSSVINLDGNNLGHCDAMILSPGPEAGVPDDMVVNPQWDASISMTSEEVESLLSSPPCSPDDSLQSSDVEWLPHSVPKKYSATPYSRPSDPVETPVKTSRVKRFDAKTKKERKKVQNKNAATRYRQKKKVEATDVAGEFTLLHDRNTELKAKVEEMEHEIKYMKGILQDIYKVKGLIT